MKNYFQSAELECKSLGEVIEISPIYQIAIGFVGNPSQLPGQEIRQIVTGFIVGWGQPLFHTCDGFCGKPITFFLKPLAPANCGYKINHKFRNYVGAGQHYLLHQEAPSGTASHAAT